MEAAAHPTEAKLARTIAGLAALFALVWIAGHSKLSRFESRMKVNPLVVTGIVFVFLGTLAAQPPIGILTGAVMAAIGPIVPLGLGWIGFRIGFDFDRNLLEKAPPAPVVFLAIVFPLLLTVAGSALVIGLANPFGRATPPFGVTC
jgi:uncharacterized membrane protein AbrB (regulator of aidB expression)